MTEKFKISVEDIEMDIDLLDTELLLDSQKITKEMEVSVEVSVLDTATGERKKKKRTKIKTVHGTLILH